MGRIQCRLVLALLLLSEGASLALSLISFSNDNEDDSRSRIFRDGETVDLWVNKLTSSSTQLPMDYYHLPFCQTEGGPRRSKMNVRNTGYALGQGLTRNHEIYETPYQLKMRRDMFCEHVCLANVGHPETQSVKTPSSRIVQAIYSGYRHHWVVDQNLASASVLEDEFVLVTGYYGGFPLGFVASSTSPGPTEEISQSSFYSTVNWPQGTTSTRSKNRHQYKPNANQKAYIYNHVNLELHYHNPGPDQYRVLRFSVRPFSIAHQFVPLDGDADQLDSHGYYLPRVAKITNPIPSCQLAYSKNNYQERLHTSYDMIVNSKIGPQLASGKVLFTYDVIWIRDSDLKWSDRWSIYLDMDGAVPRFSRWVALFKALVSAVVSSAVVLSLIKAWVQQRARQAKGKYARVSLTSNDAGGNHSSDRETPPSSGMREIRCGSNRHEDIGDSDDDSSAAENGWRQALETFVFAPPTFAPRLLVTLCGLGAQLLATCLVVLVVAASGMPVAQVRKMGGGATGGVWAWILMAFIVVYVLVGGPVGGYVTARMMHLFRLTSVALDSTENVDNSCDQITAHEMPGNKNDFNHDNDDDTKDLTVSISSAEDGNSSTNSFVGELSSLTPARMNISHILTTLLPQLAFPLSAPLLMLAVNLMELLTENTEGLYVKFPIMPILSLLILSLAILFPLLVLGYRAAAWNRKRLSSFDEIIQRDSTDEDDNLPTPNTKGPWYIQPAFQMVFGFFPFMVCYHEYYYLLFALWSDQRYGSTFGVLLVVSMATGVLSSAFSMLGTYTMLCHENYKWWWPAFVTGGSVAIFGYFYAMTWLFLKICITTWIGLVFFFLIMTWICMAWFIMMGFVGLSASLWFNLRLYQAIKAT